jgi:hypothetical protein
MKRETSVPIGLQGSVGRRASLEDRLVENANDEDQDGNIRDNKEGNIRLPDYPHKVETSKIM